MCLDFLFFLNVDKQIVHTSKFNFVNQHVQTEIGRNELYWYEVFFHGFQLPYLPNSLCDKESWAHNIKTAVDLLLKTAQPYDTLFYCESLMRDTHITPQGQPSYTVLGSRIGYNIE